jgi:uncharacterized membrane protein
MICTHCSTEMPNISVYCPSCGHSVDSFSDELCTADSREALLGAAAYVAVFPAIVLLAIPAARASRFIRFHAWQSLLFGAGAVVTGLVLKLLFLVLTIVPTVGFLFSWLLGGVVSIALVVLWAVLFVKVLQRDCYELPVIGPLAARLAGFGIPAQSSGI